MIKAASVGALSATFILVSVVAGTVGTAFAHTISSKGHGPAQVQASCTGIFAAPGKRGIYGCFTKRRGSIVCGGPTKALQETCNVSGGRLPEEEPVSSCRPPCVAYIGLDGIRRCRCP
jgi:hypothetical protein